MAEEIQDRYPAGLRPAGLLRRFAAFLVDLFLVGAIIAGLLIVAVSAVRAGLTSAGQSLPSLELVQALIGSSPLFFLLSGFILFGYFAFLPVTTGQTPGKALWGLRILRKDRPIGPITAAIRAIGYLPSLLPLGIGLLPALVTRRKRALHDLLAGTCVVRDA